MLNVNYDDSTISLKDYVNFIEIQNDKFKSVYKWPKKNNNKPSGKEDNTSPESEDTFPFYISYRHATNKCYSLDFSKEMMPGIEGKILSLVRIDFKITGLPVEYLGYYLHYPKQLMRSPLLEFEWNLNMGILAGNLNWKAFFIDSMDVIRRRNTRQNPCHKEWKRDDDMILTKIVETIGCKPSHWVLNVNLPVCNDKEKMERAKIPTVRSIDSSFLKQFVQPCDQIQTVTSTIREVQRELTNETGELSTHVGVWFKSPYYKEVQHIRALDAESLIGNMGGYVGLFLGFAFWQAPDAIRIIANKLQSIKNYFK